MKNQGIGLGEALIVFVVGGLILVLLVNPQITEDISDFFENPSGELGGPPKIYFGKLRDTYEKEYISQYLWNNYKNQKIKIPNVKTIFGFFNEEKINNIREAPYYTTGVDYYFVSTYTTYSIGVDLEDAVFLIDNENVISKARKEYAKYTTSCSFTVTGIVTQKEICLSTQCLEHENVVAIKATNIEVHHSQKE